METKIVKPKKKGAMENAKTFVKVKVVSQNSSLMECGGNSNYCNESK